MQLFYIASQPDKEDKELTLHGEEAEYCSRVLRKKEGDTLTIIDGQGTLYTADLAKIGRNFCTLRILTKQFHKPAAVSLHIACAPTKSIERFEWFLEKATEIGIAAVTPIVCFNSERRQLRNDRLEKIILAAAKQSLKFWLPVLNELTPFQSFIEAQKGYNGQKFIAHCHPEIAENGDQTSLLAPKKTVKMRYKTGENALILIGPEGDFSKEEVLMAQCAGFEPISLGQSRLRTETAALVAVSILSFLNEME